VPTRRDIVRALALAGAAGPLAGCERLISRVALGMGEGMPDRVAVAAGAEIDPAFHLLSRAAFGPRPGDLEHVRRMGAEAWVEWQLDPGAIDDTACDLRARRFETIHHEPGTCYEYKKPVLREEIVRHTLLRAVYSERQLFEVMVNFWTDHFNISIDKGDCVYLKPADDRTVVREHALGRFRDLVRASATSPAMLVYLDGKDNKHAAFGDVPNENYARELLELHTLGVDGGYTQTDVREVARCLTGWRLNTTWRKGTVSFDPALHDDGEKVVLGARIAPGGGASDLERVVDLACSHPSTPRHVARKLARRFVADDPPASVVDRAASVFAASDGDVTATVRAILFSEEFAASRGLKVKRPFEFVASALRATLADTHAHAGLVDYLGRMGHAPFQHPTPDGYADDATPWLGTLLWRWNFAFALAAGEIESVSAPHAELSHAIDSSGADAAEVFAHFVGRAPTAGERAAIDAYLGDRAPGSDATDDVVALVLASPAFQRH
jgi:uncharacterized protein (DUF1800 family)